MYLLAPTPSYNATVHGFPLIQADDAIGTNAVTVPAGGTVADTKFVKVPPTTQPNSGVLPAISRLEVVQSQAAPPEFPASNPSRQFRAPVLTTAYVAVTALPWEVVRPYEAVPVPVTDGSGGGK